MFSNKDYFVFPAVRMLQGKTVHFLLSVSSNSLSSLLTADDSGHTLERSQRKVNKLRVKKFHDYLLNADKKKEAFIVPPLVGNCDQYIIFEEVGETNSGIAKIPRDAIVKLCDGQHRAAGISMYAQSSINPFNVPLMLTDNLSLTTRQQFFSDINNNASKPSATINLSYDNRNVDAQTLKESFIEKEGYSEIIDFENNIVPSKSKYWVSFKALHDATMKFIGTGDSRLSFTDVGVIWDLWIKLTNVHKVRLVYSSCEYKKEFIQFHAVMVNAYGYMIKLLLSEDSGNTADHVINKISAFIDKSSEHDLESIFLMDNWVGTCVVQDGDSMKILASISAQRNAAVKLMDLITSH